MKNTSKNPSIKLKLRMAWILKANLHPVQCLKDVRSALSWHEYSGMKATLSQIVSSFQQRLKVPFHGGASRERCTKNRALNVVVIDG